MALQYFAQINLDRDYASFNAGDQLRFYFDDSTQAVVVKKTSTSFTHDINIIDNGNSGTFEGSPSLTEMTVTGTGSNLELSSTTARTGTQSLRANITSGQQIFVASGTQNSLYSNGTKNYYVSCWVRSIGTTIGQSSDKVFLGISDLLSVTGATLLENNEVTLLQTLSGWTKLYMRVSLEWYLLLDDLIASEKFYPIALKHNISTINANGFIYIDDLELREELTYTQAETTLSAGSDLGILNEWQLLSGSVFNNIFTSDKQFCIGTTLNRFKINLFNPSYPYAQIIQETQSPVCGFSEIVCNLVAFIVSVSSPTSAYASDGSFTIGSTSSNGERRYSFSDEIYANMVNTTGTFTGLLPGTYIIFIRDSSNCRQSISVTVPFFRGDNVKYRLEVKDIQNNTTGRIDILEKNFNGSVTEVKSGSDAPIKITRPQISLHNKYEALSPSFAEISLLSEVNYQFMNLFTQTDKQFRVNYYRPVGTLLWSGYLQSSVFSEEFLLPPYGTNVKAIDGLELLKEIPLSDQSGNALTQPISFIKLLAIVLGKLDLNLPIRCGVNTFEVTYANSAANDPFAQTYCEGGDLVDDDGTAWNCYRVLEYILKPFGATITQWAGRWNVVEVDKISQPYNYRDYDVNGNYTGNGTFDPVIEIKSPNMRMNIAFADYNHSMEVVPAYKQITVKQKLFPKKGIINSDFKRSSWNGTTWKEWQIDFVSASGSGGLVSATAGPYVQTDFLGKDITGNIEAAGIFFSQPFTKPNFSQVTVNDNFVVLKSLSKSITFIDGDVLKLSFKYILNFLFGTQPDFIKLQWIAELIVNGTKFYFSERVGWNTDPVYRYNTIYVSKFNSFETFTKDIALPNLFGVFVTGQFTFYIRVNGSNYWEFKNYAGLRNLVTANRLTLDTKVRGILNTSGNDWDIQYYALKLGTKTESLPNIVVPNDYNVSSNTVYWELVKQVPGKNGLAGVNYLESQITTVGIDDVIVQFLPGNKKASTEVNYTQLINADYRESMTIEIEGGDLPFPYYFNYSNFFKKQNGTPTQEWALSPFSTDLLQAQLLARAVRQYQSPTLKLSGNWIAYNDLGFLNVVKHVQTIETVTLVNPEMNTSGATVINWQNFGAAVPSWTGATNKASVAITSGQASTKYFIQSAQTLITAGQRLRIETNIQRTGGSARQDDFFVCFFNGGNLVQLVSINRFENDSTVTKILKVTLGQNIDNVGFYVFNWGNNSAATYLVDYFRLSVLQPIRYYALNSITKEDRNNDLQIELMQIVPLNSTNDPTTIDDGPPNGDVNVVNGAFSDGFSEGFLI